MKYIFLVSLAFVFAACSNKEKTDNSEVLLFNNFSFKLHNGEIVTESSTSIQKTFEKYFNNSAIQIPLFKHIKHTDFDIFIGVPVNTSISEINKVVLAKHNSTAKENQSNNDYCYSQYNSNGLYFTELAVNAGGKSIFYISSISSSESIADSLFNHSELSKRITKN